MLKCNRIKVKLLNLVQVLGKLSREMDCNHIMSLISNTFNKMEINNKKSLLQDLFNNNHKLVQFKLKSPSFITCIFIIACHTSIIGLNTLHKVVVPLANLQRAVHLPFFSWGLKTGTVYPMQLRQY